MAGPGDFFTRPWDGQPQYDIEIAREWRDLVAFASVSGVPSGRGDIVSGKQPSIFGTINRQATKYGLASKPSAAASTRYQYTTRPVASVTDGYSILTVAAPVSSGSAVKRMVVLGNEAASAFAAVTLAFNLSKTGTTTAGYACLIEYNSGFLASCDASAVVDGESHVFVAVRSPGNVAPALFVDGALRTFSSTSSAATFTPDIITSLHGSPGASSAQGASDESLLTVIFNRPLTGQQVSTLGRIGNLWSELFKPRRIFVPVAAAGGGASVGLCSEANSALALAAVQRRLSGLSTEADAALSFAATQVRPSGLSLESDAAQTLAAVQRRNAGLAVEADAAIALRSVQVRPAGLAAETSSSLALSARQIRAAGLATESDAALALSAPGGATVGLSSEADVALALTARQVRTAGLAAETSTALALAPGAAPGAVGLATETATALALAAVQRRGIGLATETGAALPLPVVVARGVSLALEIDAGFALGIVQRRAVGRSDELDAALTLAGGGSPEPAADPERTYFVPAESRVWRVPAELRTHAAPPETRTYRPRIK